MADILSDTTNLSNLVPTYYSKRLLERLEPNVRAYQLAEKRKIPANSGKTILWNRYVQLNDGALLTEGTPIGPSALSTVPVSATLVQYGNLVKITDLVDETAISNVVKDAVDVLADNAAKTIDKYILDTVTGFMSTIGTSAAFVTYQFPQLYSATADALDGELWGSPTTQLNSSVVKTVGMTVSAIRACVTHLRTLNVSPHEDGYYHSIIHPVVADKLRGSTDYVSWSQYTRPEKMERGLVGEVEGVKFYDDAVLNKAATATVKGFTFTGTATTSALGTFYHTTIFGRGAYAVTELEGTGTGDNGTKVYVVPRNKADKNDPLQQFGYVGYKATLAAKILNPSCGVVLLTNN